MLNNESSTWYIQRIYTNPEKARNNQINALGCSSFGSTNVNGIEASKEFENIFKLFQKLAEVNVFCPKSEQY